MPAATGAVVAVGAGIAWIAGRDGSPGWQALRVALAAGLTLAAARAVGRAGREATPATGALAVAVGLVGVGAGAGIAAPHVSKTGASAVAVAGAASLAGGLVLLGVQDASPGSVEVWVVPGAGHTAGLDAAPAEWERRVTTFLAGALGDPSCGPPEDCGPA